MFCFHDDISRGSSTKEETETRENRNRVFTLVSTRFHGDRISNGSSTEGKTEAEYKRNLVFTIVSARFHGDVKTRL